MVAPMMRIVWGSVLAAALTGCGPSLPAMDAAEAEQVIVRFSNGADADVCTEGGRARLRAAVRAFSAAKAAAGEAWPWSIEPEVEVDGPDQSQAAMMLAVSAGWIEAGDLQSGARIPVRLMQLGRSPELTQWRTLMNDSCEDVVAMQRAFVSMHVEAERLQRLRDRGADGERQQRQARRIERAQREFERRSEVLERRLEDIRAEGETG